MKGFLITLAFVIGAAYVAETGSGVLTATKSYLFSHFDSSTEGSIVESRMFKWGRFEAPRPRIVYEYSVGGVSYFGMLVNYKGVEVDDLKDKYPVGKKVTVYYDSTNVMYSILEKTSFSGGYITQLILIFIAIPLIGFLSFWNNDKWG